MSNKTKCRGGTYQGATYKKTINDINRGITMNRKMFIIVLLLLGLALLSCAAQKPIPDSARIVQLQVPTCD
jgi:hypothetical protein